MNYFATGKPSYRFFTLPKDLPEDVVERFNELTLPGLGTPVDGPIFGWTTSRHMLERNIAPETAHIGGYLSLTLVEASFKISPAMLKSACEQEELADLAATEREYLSRKEKSEIRKSVIDVMLPNAQPTMKGTTFILLDKSTLIVNASSDRQSDIFVMHFRQATGVSPIPMVPENAGIERLQLPTATWCPVSYSETVEPHEVSDNIGLDFLTWLWFMAETREGILRLDGLPETHIMIEGPLTFVMEGEGAHETVLRKGAPTLSPESSACLRAGKKLSKAKLHLSMNGDLWSTMIDASAFGFSGTKLPDPEEPLEAMSLFTDRISRLEQFNGVFFGLLDHYLNLRNTRGPCVETTQEMKNWVKSRD